MIAYSILVLGYFGHRTNQLDGQTVKTRDLYRLVVEEGGKESVSWFDTQDFQYNKLSVFALLKKLVCCKSLFYLPAYNNLKYMFPAIFVLSKIFRFRILYFVIGGWLVEYLKNKPLHRWMLKRIDGIFSETKLMHSSLNSEYDFENVEVFSNFRFSSFKSSFHHSDGRLKLVFLARINKLKGLDTIFYLAEYIRNKYQIEQISIDFYGQLYKPDEDYFFEKVGMYDFVTYRGELQPEKINETIEKYDVMLLPTHYYTEGLPGTVLDAYMSGIPVIVSKWKYAEEFVTDGETGFIIPFENGEEQLCSKIDLLFYDTDLLTLLKHNALKKSLEYSSEKAWSIISEFIT